MLRSFFITTLMVGVVFLSGCGNTTTEQNVGDTEKGNKQGISLNNRPERTADVVGIVKSIVGNEVVVNQVDMEAVREQMAANMPEGAEPSGNNLVDSGTKIPGMGGGMRTNLPT